MQTHLQNQFITPTEPRIYTTAASSIIGCYPQEVQTFAIHYHLLRSWLQIRWKFVRWSSSPLSPVARLISIPYLKLRTDPRHRPQSPRRAATSVDRTLDITVRPSIADGCDDDHKEIDEWSSPPAHTSTDAQIHVNNVDITEVALVQGVLATYLYYYRVRGACGRQIVHSNA